MPKSAQNIKYFDEVGKISQSGVFHNINYTTLRHQTRYPLLFGGWKASFVIQYTVPTCEHLEEKNGIFYLRVKALDHTVNDALVEEAFVKILLPEGAVIKKINAPKWFNASEESHYTSLCFFGRKTAALSGRMLVKDQIADVEVVYEFSDFWLLKSPIVLTIYLQVVFVFIIIVNRFK